MAGELLGSERVLAIRRLSLLFGGGIVVGIDDQLPLDFDRLIDFVVEVQPPAEPA